MKLLERVLEKRIRWQVSLDNNQFGFMHGKGTMYAIFTMRQVQEKHQAKKKKLYYVFCGFRCIGCKSGWWARCRHICNIFGLKDLGNLICLGDISVYGMDKLGMSVNEKTWMKFADENQVGWS